MPHHLRDPVGVIVPGTTTIGAARTGRPGGGRIGAVRVARSGWMRGGEELE